MLSKQKGYTLVETMIAISVFFIVITLGLSALLNANLVSKKNQYLRSVLDNLSYIMDDISRHIRTGSDILCSSDGGITFTSNTEPPDLCSTTKHISFISNEAASTNGSDTRNRIDYKIQLVDANNAALGYKISRSETACPDSSPECKIKNEDFVQLNVENIKFNDSSGFKLFGTKPNDNKQPLVVIHLNGSIIYKDGSVPFNLQTAASQRLLDL